MRRPREIKKYDAGRRHRRHRVQKQVRNVSSDAPATFCGDWRHLEAISRKSPKWSIFYKKSPPGTTSFVSALTWSRRGLIVVKMWSDRTTVLIRTWSTHRMWHALVDVSSRELTTSFPDVPISNSFFFLSESFFSGHTANQQSGPAVELASSDGLCAKEHLLTLTDGHWSSRRRQVPCNLHWKY